MTGQQQVGYADLLRVWRDADAVPQIEHAWLFDHFQSIGSSAPYAPVLEGWTLLAALAAHTSQLRMGVLVSSNRMRPPAVLAKIATTVDHISQGRLEFGIGVGSRMRPPEARQEYPAHGIPFAPFSRAVTSLDEACVIIKRLWTETDPFDFHGTEYDLIGAHGSPKPVQSPWPPITVAGRSEATLEVAARHADRWNIAGGDIADCVERSSRLSELCQQNHRRPEEVIRSIVIAASLDRPDESRHAITTAIGAGFTHIILGLGAPLGGQTIPLTVDILDGLG